MGRTPLGFPKCYFPMILCMNEPTRRKWNEETRTSEREACGSDYFPADLCTRTAACGVYVCARHKHKERTTHQIRRERTNIYTFSNQRIVFFFLLPGWRCCHPTLLLVNISGCCTRVTESERTQKHGPSRSGQTFTVLYLWRASPSNDI